MKTKILLTLLIFSISLNSYSVTIQISANSDQFTFTPASVTINLGDEVNFTLSSNHNAVEVSQTVWQDGGTTSNGGFSMPFGGGIVSASKLTLGRHYYVCTPHASFGMKGIIDVVSPTGIEELKLSNHILLAPNPARNYFSITLNDNTLLNSEFTLYNMLGKQLLTGKLTDKTTTVNIDNQAQGIYFVRFKGFNNSAYKLEIRK
ncbi:MAG: T9SS type A sorting domain-containing protein [Paludibacter sp.]|nr:T9SS type A sorting domain-containing protein [Paludibacter sp.]